MRDSLESGLAQLEAHLANKQDHDGLKLLESIRFNAVNVIGQKMSMESVNNINRETISRLYDIIGERKNDQ